MSLFSKRESLTQNIAYMGIMAAINVISTVLMTYVLPILFIPLVLLLPLTSTIVTLFCKKRYFIIYFIATSGICALATFNNISDTLFYVVPSLISGFIFGIMIEHHISSSLTIFISSLITTGLSYAFIPLIQFIYGQNMIQIISTIFGLQDFIFLAYIVPVFILLTSIIQETISYFVIINELPKLGINEEEKETILPYIIGLTGSILSLIFYFIYPTFTYFFIVYTIFFAVNIILILADKKAFKPLIIMGIVTVIFFIIFAVLFPYINSPFQLLTLHILFDSYLIIGLVNFTLTKNTKLVE